MSNILNSHIVNNNNVIPAKPILNKNRKNQLGVISAPTKVSSFSLEKELKKKDEFRKSVLNDLNSQKIRQKKRNSFYKTIFIMAATLISYKYFKGKV